MATPDHPPTAETTPRLPELTAGLTLLDADSDVDRALHALAVDHVLLSGGTACWIDPGTRARTDPLVELAPSARILDRIRVARAFTPFQHLALVTALPELVTDRTELLVVPAFDGYYRTDDLLGDEGREMLLAGLAALAGVAREHDLPVLVTRERADEFAAPIATATTRTIRCEATLFGPRFRASDGGDGSDETRDETLVYPSDCGRYVQTTLAFWERVLAAREPLHGSQDTGVATPEVISRGAH